MADQQPTTRERLQAIMKKLDNGADARAAAGAGSGATSEETKQASVPAPVAVTSKTGSTRFADPLRKAFETLASMHKGYAVLGSEKALADPTGFLMEKDANNNYKVSSAQLGGMIATLLKKDSGKAGVPFEEWAERSGHKSLIEKGFEAALAGGMFDADSMGAISRALDSTGGSGGPLIREDVEQLVRVGYLRKFPAAEAFNAVPANGIEHSYNVETSPGDASTLDELGDLGTVDSDTSYERDRTNVAILATRRAVSLKLQFASAQSGMNYNLSGPTNRNVMGGITAIANKDQSLVLQGNYTDNTGTLNNELGLYDALGFDGLRKKLSGAGTSINKADDETYLHVINKAIAEIANAGGSVEDTLVLRSYGASLAIDAELQQFYRIENETPKGGVDSALSRVGIRNVAGALSKFTPVPSGSQGQGIGYYDVAGPVTMEDVYVCDPGGIEKPYLGSPTPTVLELPIGFNGRLSSVYVIFLMTGLAVFIPSFHRKIRIKRQTV
jgi:hypothetical protein